MVLFRRKPVQFLPPADVEDEEQEVWHIPLTGEIFASYEDFLSRMDFYKQRRFNDEITGHSGLTFFEAYNSELAGGREVEQSFPEALKGPVLHKVQFQTVSRLDNLVDYIYEEFKQDYYPGEVVVVFRDNSDTARDHGLVREKTAFGPRVLPDGSRSLPTTRYLVLIHNPDKGEEAVSEDQLCRDRGVFTKSMLRAFLKRTVIREAWNGAPWLVKHEYASQYHIDTKIPPHLRYDTKLMERKQLQAQKRAVPAQQANGHGPDGDTEPVRLPELKPVTKSHKGKQHGKGMKWMDMPVHGTHHVGYGSPHQCDHTPASREPTPPPPPPPPKYPIEDLQLEPQNKVRPALRFMCAGPPTQVDVAASAEESKLRMESVGPLLETWDTLNVYCEVFKLDSFTFDDFVQAMSVASERVHVQLFEEIHCSVLKVLVDSEADGGKIRITVPELEEEGSEGESEEEEEQETSETASEPEPKPVGRATRSSLAKLEAERLAAEAAAAEEESMKLELESRHRAEEALKKFNWVEHLRQRDFASGGWEMIVVGLLHQLAKNERRQKSCENLLLQLVPPDVAEPTQESVRQRYATLDINHRVQVLQILCMLTMETKAVRGYMEDCSETMTKYRKDRIEWQRQRKQAIEELKQLNERKKTLLPECIPPSPPADSVKVEEDGKANGVDVADYANGEDAEDLDEDTNSRKKRRRTHAEKHRKKDEVDGKEKRQKREKNTTGVKEAGAPTPKFKLPGQAKQFAMLAKEIRNKEETIKECEAEIAVIENDLREADCPRTRVMGKDRFWNRYYWFERNGMPYAGLPNSSTASAGYANGRIWVQGPDDLERQGYIEAGPEHQEEYRSKFNMTVVERKALEEGETSVHDAVQWGYIADPTKVDELILWLDPRGFNEVKLRKELVAFRDKIMTHMEARQRYLAAAEEKENKKEEAAKRVSSRIRDRTPEPPSYRCLRWENTMALEELGHLHVEPPPKPRGRKGGGVGAAAMKKREASEGTVEVASGRASKASRRR